MEKLIPELVRRGYRVGTIKHDVHGFEIDREGKDSYRHKKAGAAVTIISSPHKVAVIADAEKDHEPTELRDLYLHNVDIIITEGYKRNNYPKIEVFRSDLYPEILCHDDESLIALVGDKPKEVRVPHFPPEAVTAVVDLIEERFLKGKI